MSAMCPPGQNTDSGRTALGQCLDFLRTSRVCTDVPAGARIPTRPDPTQDRPGEGEGLDRSIDSPSPSFPHRPTVRREVWQILVGGLHSLSENDEGRPWPYPRRDRLAALLAEHDADLCIRAAQEAREIVQSQDRAPNITALFEKKLAEAAEVRSTVRESLERAA
jgi:hypothetical protein